MKHSLKNRILAAFLTACLLFASAEFLSLAADSGSCGSKVKWSLSDDGILSITGKGSMSNFSEGTMAPWYHERENITAVMIKDGLTNIGTLAFYGCTSLQSIALPESITKIGDMAFAGCKNLERATLSDGLKSI